MKRAYLDTLTAVAALAFAAALIFAGYFAHQKAQASTDFGNYAVRQITSANASSTASTRLQGPGTLGSVVVLVPSPASTTAATTLGFYDGSSSATSSATLLFTVPTSTPAGTYTFDVNVSQGLIVDVPRAFTGNVVVTHRL